MQKPALIMCKITNLFPQQLYSTTCWACYSDTITCLSEVLLHRRYVAMKLCIALHKTSLLTSTLFLGTSFSHHSHSRGLDGQEIMWPSSSLLVSSTPQLLGHLTILYPQLARWSCNKKNYNYWLCLYQYCNLLCTPSFSPAKCSYREYRKTTLLLVLSLLPCPWTDPQVTFQYYICCTQLTSCNWNKKVWV